MLRPLFKFAGGKTVMLKKYEPHIPEKIDVYVEPFLGGGAMFAHVWNTRRPKQSFLSDADPDIMEIYGTIKTNPNAFLSAIEHLVEHYLTLPTNRLRKDYYLDRRHSYGHHGHEWDQVDRAANLFFLMKTCFSGFYQRNISNNGKFGTPPGMLEHKKSFVDRDLVFEWSEALGQSEIRSCDWVEAVDRSTMWGAHHSPREQWLFFFDPPYRGASLKKAYMKTFEGDEEQLRLVQRAALLTRTENNRVMIANRDVGDGFWANRGLEVETWGRRSTIGRGSKSTHLWEVLLHG